MHIYRKLGFGQPDYSQRYLLLRSLTPIVRGHLTSGWARALANGLARPVWACADGALRMLNHFRTRKADFVEVSPHACDGLPEVLGQIAANRDLHFNLSVDKLLWKVAYSARAGGETSIHILRARADSRPMGYAVVRTWTQTKPLAERYKDFRLVTLMDYGLVAETEDAYAAMLTNIFQLAVEYGAEVLEVICHAPELRRLARRYGLLAVGKGMSFSYILPADWDLSGVDVYDSATWRANHYSGDGLLL